jgi:hypothetical protein
VPNHMHQCACREKYDSEQGRIDCEKSHVRIYHSKQQRERIRALKDQILDLTAAGEVHRKWQRRAMTLLLKAWTIAGDDYRAEIDRFIRGSIPETDDEKNKDPQP